jgi:hypothetical protein
MQPLASLVGQRFGRLTVVRQSASSRHGATRVSKAGSLARFVWVAGARAVLTSGPECAAPGRGLRVMGQAYRPSAEHGTGCGWTARSYGARARFAPQTAGRDQRCARSAVTNWSYSMRALRQLSTEQRCLAKSRTVRRAQRSRAIIFCSVSPAWCSMRFARKLFPA